MISVWRLNKIELVKSHVWIFNFAQVKLIWEKNDFREYLNYQDTKSLKLPINVCDPKAPSLAYKAAQTLPNLLWDEQTNLFSRPAAAVPRRWSWLHASEEEAYNLSIWQSRATLNPAGSAGSTPTDPGYMVALRWGGLHDGGGGSLVHQFLDKSISVLMQWH